MIEEKMIKDIICYEKLFKKFVRGALSNRELNPSLNNTFRPIAQNIFFSSWNFHKLDQISFLLISILRKKIMISDLWFILWIFSGDFLYYSALVREVFYWRQRLQSNQLCSSVRNAPSFPVDIDWIRVNIIRGLTLLYGDASSSACRTNFFKKWNR